jgi:uncharacterized membrane protein
LWDNYDRASTLRLLEEIGSWLAAPFKGITMHHLGDVQYFPLALPFFVILAGALLLLLALVQVQVLRYAYLQLGVSPEAALLLLAGSLFGSYVNIPIAVLGHETMVANLIYSRRLAFARVFVRG